jgi:protein O-mannosyl-transferase
VLLAGLLLCWTALTAFTAYAWGNPLRLAEDLATRAPQSPRAQYELGRTYIIYSHYDPASPFTSLAYAPLEKAAALPHSSILPEQALIFMNARMGLPLKNAWWDSLIAKLKAHKPGVQDESSLGALTQCTREQRCDLPPDRMIDAFMAALSHPNPSARLLATYGDYAWNVIEDHDLGERMTEEAVKARPNEPAYQITLIRMLVVQGRKAEARDALKQLETLNIGGQLNNSLSELRALLGLQ